MPELGAGHKVTRQASQPSDTARRSRLEVLILAHRLGSMIAKAADTEAERLELSAVESPAHRSRPVVR